MTRTWPILALTAVQENVKHADCSTEYRHKWNSDLVIYLHFYGVFFPHTPIGWNMFASVHYNVLFKLGMILGLVRTWIGTESNRKLSLPPTAATSSAPALQPHRVPLTHSNYTQRGKAWLLLIVWQFEGVTASFQVQSAPKFGPMFVFFSSLSISHQSI